MTPETEPPTLAEIKAAGQRRKRDADRLKQSSDALKELVLAALRAGAHGPVKIANESGWTPAYVRKLARENGIEPDERYRERAELMRARAQQAE
jgi:hypothetical protein